MDLQQGSAGRQLRTHNANEDDPELLRRNLLKLYGVQIFTTPDSCRFAPPGESEANEHSTYHITAAKRKMADVDMSGEPQSFQCPIANVNHHHYLHHHHHRGSSLQSQSFHSSAFGKEGHNNNNSTNNKGSKLKKRRVRKTWTERFQQLKEFKDRFGHCKVPKGWNEDPKLARWVQ